MKKLSIITINRNDRSGLEKTFASVFSQTFSDFEYIVIDGASSDGSKELIEEYADKLDYWVSESDTGIYNAMNKGILHAHGEYCLFLNSGDFLTSPEILTNLFSHDFSEDIVSCSLRVFGQGKEFIKMPPIRISLFSLNHASLSHQSTLIKTQLFQTTGYYLECYRIMSDWCFFVHALIRDNCSYRSINIILASFNCYGISSTSCSLEHDASCSFLNREFPRITKDYFIEEPVFNCLYWFHTHHSILFKLFSLPFKIINRIFKLRNRLRLRVTVHKI